MLGTRAVSGKEKCFWQKPRWRESSPVGTRENCIPGRGTSPAKGNMFERRQEFQGSGMEGLAWGQV